MEKYITTGLITFAGVLIAAYVLNYMGWLNHGSPANAGIQRTIPKRVPEPYRMNLIPISSSLQAEFQG